MFLLDTNVISELRKRRGLADQRVVEWAAARDVRGLHVSVVTVLEIEIGVARIERHDETQGERLRAWFNDRVLAAFAGRILPITLDVARRAASLHVPNPRPERDAWIAATAAAAGLSVATRNVRDFEGAGARVVNPWMN